MADRNTATFLGYPFDKELFMQMWSEAPDPVLTAMLESGAMITDSSIASQIQGDGNYYTIPYYNPLDGTPGNYDGKTDVPVKETSGTSQSGIVYGRTQGFMKRNFVAELSGSDPMRHIAGTVARFWAKYRQSVLLGILGGVFNTTDAGAYATEFKQTHIMKTGASIGVTDANRLMTKSMGDHKQEYSMAIMHSIVAERLENLQVLEFWKQTLASGIQRPLPLASYNGLTVVIDDGVPVTGNEYTTYLFGNGVLRQANGRLDNPTGVESDEIKYGGVETLVTRLRETIHPYGWHYTIPIADWTESPTDEQLFDSANWSLRFNPKSIALSKLVTTESPTI